MNRRLFLRRLAAAAAAGATTPSLVSAAGTDAETDRARNEAIEYLAELAREPQMRAEIRTERGGPRLFINGVETYPLFALSTHLYPTIGNFRQAGIHLYHPLVGLRSGWIGPGQYDWSRIEDFLGELLVRDPEARFLPRVQLNTPNWWKEAHPGECITYGRTAPEHNYDIVRQRGLELSEGGHHLMSGGELWEASFASDPWREDTEAALRAFVRHLDASPLGRRILGYHTTTGATGEWNCFGANFLPDTSPPMRAACGPIPSAEARMTTRAGLLRDPRLEGDVIRFYDNFHQTIADAVLRFPRAIKEETDGRILCGVYYGYLLEQVRIQDGGYLAPRRIFDSPHLDYIAGPYAYQPGNVTDENGVEITMVDGAGNRYGHARGVGGDGGWRMLVASLERRGKLFFCEMDPSSYLDARPHEVHGGAGGVGSDTLEGSLMILQRDLGQMFVRGAGGWIYDFGPLNQAPDGWYASRPIIDTFRSFVDLGSRRADLDTSSVAEIAVVCDERTFAATQHWEAERPWDDFGIRYSDFFNHWFLNTQSRAIHRMGAPADCLHQWDVDSACPDRYRLFLMLNTFRLTEVDVDRILARFENSGATVVWYYAPGYIGEAAFSPPQMEKLTGFRFEVRSEPGPMMIRTVAGEESRPDGLSFGVNAEHSPRFAITEGAEDILGHWTDGAGVALAAREYRGFRSVYTGAAPLPVELLRTLAARAGLALWSDRPDIVYAGRDAAMVVATAPGVRNLHWPRAMEAVEGGPASPSHRLDLKNGEVRLFTRAAGPTGHDRPKT